MEKNTLIVKAMKNNILIVNAEHNFRFSAGIALKKNGYRIQLAGDTEEALMLVLNSEKEEDPFDLLLVDIRMPEMTGLKLIYELKKRGTSIPILAVSEFCDKKLGDKLLSMGCTLYLEKPLKPQELIKQIESIVEKAPDPPD